METIKNNSGYFSALALIEKFIEKGFDNLSPQETEELAQLSKMVELYEMKKYPMPLQTSVTNLLESVMREKRINKSELSKILEISNSTLSEILNGKRSINLKIAKKLHEKCMVDGNVILELQTSNSSG
jgi:HTH-type transcriptional regulator/antitoxin HigA